MNPVKAHFDKVSVKYSKFSQRGLWKILRNKEARAILNLLPEITDSTSALDLGSGSGFYSDILYQHNIRDITCVDFSDKMLNQIKNPLYKKIQADIENFNSGVKYDIILCAGALEFTNEAGKVFENISSMLNMGGTLILLYPAKSFLGVLYKFYHRLHGFSVRLFNIQEVSLLITNAGLRSVSSVRVFPFTSVLKCVHE